MTVAPTTAGSRTLSVVTVVHSSESVTAKVEVPWGRAVLVVKRIATVWERQLDYLWRQGLCPGALANLEGDSIW